jgi:hypothetical protein
LATASEGREVFGNGYGSRVPALDQGAAFPAAASWAAPTSGWFNLTGRTAFFRTTPVLVDLAFLGGASPAELAYGIGIDGTLQEILWNPAVNVGLNVGSARPELVVGAPAATSWGPGRLDLFAVGRDQTVWHAATVQQGVGGSWSPEPFESLGGAAGSLTTSKPAAVTAFGGGRIDVFANSVAHGLQQFFCAGAGCDGAGWFGPFSLGFTPNGIVGNAVVVSAGPNLLDIFVVDGGGTLYHKSWNGAQWLPSNTGFDAFTIAPAVAVN